MNKRFFQRTCLLTAAVATLASCSSDETVSSVPENTQVITLAVASAGDNFVATRAKRPLYSSEAKQDIKTVKVVIYKLADGLPDGVTTNEALVEKVKNGDYNTAMYGSSKTIVAQKVFDPWMTNGVSSSYSNATDGSGRLASWTLAATDQITEEGVYMAYAVGYNENEYAELKSDASFPSLTKTADTNTFTFPLSIAQNTAEDGGVPKVYEVFAGSAPFLVKKKAVTEGGSSTEYSYEFNVSLTLHRQVAGTIGYFTNIPVKGNVDHADAVGAKLRLVASNRSDNAVFAYFNSEYTGTVDTNNDGIPASGDDTKVKYVVNGYDNTGTTKSPDAKFYNSTANDAYIVYEVKLSDWFKGTSGTTSVGGTTVAIDTNGDGLLNASDATSDGDWVNPLDNTNTTPKVKKGTVLAGSFLFPFATDGTTPTFQLQMLAEDGTIIRFWNIRLQTSSTSSDSQIGKTATKVDKDGKTEENSVKDTFVNYSVLRNHLYSIGARNKGDDGGDDDTDDKAQPLNNETLILRVNDNWEMIHQMDID